MAMSVEYMLKFVALYFMVTSPSEWKILEWDENPQTNTQTNMPSRIMN